MGSLISDWLFRVVLPYGRGTVPCDVWDGIKLFLLCSCSLLERTSRFGGFYDLTCCNNDPVRKYPVSLVWLGKLVISQQWGYGSKCRVIRSNPNNGEGAPRCKNSVETQTKMRGDTMGTVFTSYATNRSGFRTSTISLDLELEFRISVGPFWRCYRSTLR